MENKSNKKAPADVGASVAGAQNCQHVQHTPRSYSRQELKDSLVTFAMTTAGLHIALTRKYGEGDAYRMLLKAFQLGCMDSDTIHAEGQAARAYFAQEDKEHEQK